MALVSKRHTSMSENNAVGDVLNVAEKTTTVEKVCKKFELLYETSTHFFTVYSFISIMLAWGDLATMFGILGMQIFAQISLTILWVVARVIRVEVEHARWMHEAYQQWCA